MCGLWVLHCFEVLYPIRWGYQKRRAYKEDPYVFVEKDSKLWQSVKYVLGLGMSGRLTVILFIFHYQGVLWPSR